MCTSLKGQLDISFVDLPEEISQKPMPPLPPPLDVSGTVTFSYIVIISLFRSLPYT